MISKLIEVRDRGTCVMMMATQLGTDANFEDERSQERWILWHAGYGRDHDDHRSYILLSKLSGGEPNESHTDPFTWSNRRTYTSAHLWIREHFAEIKTGQVVDVEFVLGEVEHPKVSERIM